MNFTIARKPGSGAIVWSEDQTHYIIQEYQEKDRTLKELSEEFNVQPQAIRNLLRKNQIEITNKKIRNYPRDSYYFDNIDSKDKAYWLGIMYSDGYVNNKNEIRLTLKDKEHVEKFRSALQAVNHKIIEIKDTRWKNLCITYSLAIRDKILNNSLKKLGVISNKTYKNMNFPNISVEFYFDFIRGYFDGDGSIYWSKSKNFYLIDFCGQFNFLNELKHILKKDKLSLCQNSKSKQTYNLKIGGKKDIFRILNLMYKDSTEETRLDRKYNLVQQCLSLGAYTLEPVNAGCD